MAQNESRRVWGFGEIWKKFDDYLKKWQFLSKFGNFGEIYENAQNTLKMGGRGDDN